MAVEPNEVLKMLRQAISDSSTNYSGSIVDNHVILTVPREDQHYWSPQLSLEVEKDDDGTLIRGLFGPKPSVWTMFMFFYTGMGFFTLMGLMWGVSQQMIGQDPYGYWFAVVGLALLLLIYFIASIGKGMGRKQMHGLYEFYNQAITSKESSSVIKE
jgi:hypothetical protein